MIFSFLILTKNKIMTTYKDPLKDGKSRIELIDSMGNDLSIVNDGATRLV